MQICPGRNRNETMILKAKAARLLVGDRVLVKVLAHEGKHKLADKWTADIYVVVSQPNIDIPVYRVKREDGLGQEKTLHHNNLFHLGTSLLDESQKTVRYESDNAEIASAPIPQRDNENRTRQRSDTEERILHSVSDSEDEEVAFTEKAIETPAFASGVADEEDTLGVDESTHHVSADSDVRRRNRRSDRK